MKMVILRGIPGSGKSTYAKNLVADLGYKRVNKDDLRAMVDNGVWSAENEDLINDLNYALVQALLLKGVPIVVDNSHGAERHVRRLKQLAELHDYEVEIKVFKTPIETCIARDKVRHLPVGEAVIRRFLTQPFFKELYSEQLEQLPETISSGSSQYRGPVRGMRDDRRED